MTTPIDLSYPKERTLKAGRLYWRIPLDRMVKIEGYKYTGVVTYDDKGAPQWNDEKMEYWYYDMGYIQGPVNGPHGFRKPTFWEFIWYKDPDTRGLKIGANRAWPLLFANAIGVAGIIANGIPTDFWTGLVTTVCSGITVGTILGTLSNYRKQWR